MGFVLIQHNISRDLLRHHDCKMSLYIFLKQPVGNNYVSRRHPTYWFLVQDKIYPKIQHSLCCLFPPNRAKKLPLARYKYPLPELCLGIVRPGDAWFCLGIRTVTCLEMRGFVAAFYWCRHNYSLNKA
jgi:hypothetical protein